MSLHTSPWAVAALWSFPHCCPNFPSVMFHFSLRNFCPSSISARSKAGKGASPHTTRHHGHSIPPLIPSLLSQVFPHSELISPSVLVYIILLSIPHPQSEPFPSVWWLVGMREETFLSRTVVALCFEVVAKGSFTKAAGHHGRFGHQGTQTCHIPTWQPSRFPLPHASFFGSTASGPQPRSQPP